MPYVLCEYHKDIYPPQRLRFDAGMNALTRRRLDTENLESWGIFDGDVRVGGLTKVNGTGSQVLWQWACGFYPGCNKRTQQSGGNCETFDEAKARFQETWDRLEPQITPAMRTEWLEHQAFTAWKYAMHEAGCRMPTQNATGRSRCFCGADLAIAAVPEHVRTAHMGTKATAGA